MLHNLFSSNIKNHANKIYKIAKLRKNKPRKLENVKVVLFDIIANP